MPGFIVAAVPASDTGGALGLYQLVRNVGLSIGSAISGLLIAHYTPAHQALPTLDGFTINMKVAAVLLALSGIVGFVLIGGAKGVGSRTAEVERESGYVSAGNMGIDDEGEGA